MAIMRSILLVWKNSLFSEDLQAFRRQHPSDISHGRQPYKLTGLGYMVGVHASVLDSHKGDRFMCYRLLS
jgi:hypothetical protein